MFIGHVLPAEHQNPCAVCYTSIHSKDRWYTTQWQNLHVFSDWKMPPIRSTHRITHLNLLNALGSTVIIMNTGNILSLVSPVNATALIATNNCTLGERHEGRWHWTWRVWLLHVLHKEVEWTGVRPLLTKFWASFRRQVQNIVWSSWSNQRAADECKLHTCRMAET